MNIQRIIPCVVLASLITFGCNTPKSDGTAKHDADQTTSATPASNKEAPGASGGTQSAAAPAAGDVIHVADVASVEGSLAGGKIAPNFSWKDAEGKEHSLKEYSGKVVMLNFWGTWCPPCRAELPDIVKLRNELHETGFEVIGLGLGEQARGGQTPAQRVAEFAKKNNLNYPLLLADERLAEAYGGIEGVPTTFILNGKGEVVDKMVGMQSESVFRAAIKKAM